MATKTVIVVTAIPVQDGEEPETLATKAADAVVAAVGCRDGEGIQMWGETTETPRAAASLAIRAVIPPKSWDG